MAPLTWGSVDLGGTIGTLYAGARLRTAYWRGAAEKRGTVILVQGRGEFIEVYGETIADLHDRGFSVLSYDQRDQGGSQRRTRRGGHIRSYKSYADDLVAVVKFAQQVGLPRPYHVVAHSMGGLAAVVAQPRLLNEVDRMVLLAPALRLASLPMAPGLIVALARLGALVGLDRNRVGGATNEMRPFRNNRLTSDPERYQTLKTLTDANPDLTIGAPTLGWVEATITAGHRITRHMGTPLAIPTLFITASRDDIVATPAIDTFARSAPGSGAILLPGARHQVLLERDELRDLVFAAMDAFLGDVQPKAAAARSSSRRALRFEASPASRPDAPPTRLRPASVRPRPVDASPSAAPSVPMGEAATAAVAVAEPATAIVAPEPMPAKTGDQPTPVEVAEAAETHAGPAADRTAPGAPSASEETAVEKTAEPTQVAAASTEAASEGSRPAEAPADRGVPDAKKAKRLRKRILARRNRQDGADPVMAPEKAEAGGKTESADGADTTADARSADELMAAAERVVAETVASATPAETARTGVGAPEVRPGDQRKPKPVRTPERAPADGTAKKAEPARAQSPQQPQPSAAASDTSPPVASPSATQAGSAGGSAPAATNAQPASGAPQNPSEPPEPAGEELDRIPPGSVPDLGKTRRRAMARAWRQERKTAPAKEQAAADSPPPRKPAAAASAATRNVPATKAAPELPADKPTKPRVPAASADSPSSPAANGSAPRRRWIRRARPEAAAQADEPAMDTVRGTVDAGPLKPPVRVEQPTEVSAAGKAMPLGDATVGTAADVSVPVAAGTAPHDPAPVAVEKIGDGSVSTDWLNYPQVADAPQTPGTATTMWVPIPDRAPPAPDAPPPQDEAGDEAPSEPAGTAQHQVARPHRHATPQGTPGQIRPGRRLLPRAPGRRRP